VILKIIWAIGVAKPFEDPRSDAKERASISEQKAYCGELTKPPKATFVSFGSDRGKRFSENHEATAPITPVADDDWQRPADGVAMALTKGLPDEDAFPDIRKAVRSFVGESNRLLGRVSKSATTPSARPDKTDKSPSVSSVSDQGRGVSENHVVPGTLESVANPDRDFEERAAIAAIGGGLPRDIAEGLARLDTMRPPEGFGQSRWHLIVNDAALFADIWVRGRWHWVGSRSNYLAFIRKSLLPGLTVAVWPSCSMAAMSRRWTLSQRPSLRRTTLSNDISAGRMIPVPSRHGC
jgi:hypothetical protein